MKEYAKCLYYENACFDNPIVTVRDGQDRKHLTLEEVVGLLNEQQSTITALKEENEQLGILLKERQYKKDIALYDLVNSLTVENRELRRRLLK